jgi:hypothetical protein
VADWPRSCKKPVTAVAGFFSAGIGCMHELRVRCCAFGMSKIA